LLSIMDLVTLHNNIARKHHILASYLKHKHYQSSALFLSNLNTGLRKDLMQMKMVDAIHARVKNADNLMIVVHISGEKHLYMLNTRTEEIRYQQGG
jgi:hypothetical protein